MASERQQRRRQFTARLASQRLGSGRAAEEPLLPAGPQSGGATPAEGALDYRDYRQLDYRLHRAGGGSPAAPRAPEPSRQAGPVLAAAILVIGFLSSLGSSITGPTLTELLIKRACDRRSIPYPSDACSTSAAAQSEAASRTQLIYLSSLPALLTLGTYSLLMDTRGRRPVLVLGVLSSSVFPLLIAVLPDKELFHIGSVAVEGFGVVIAGASLASLLGAIAGKIAQFAVISDLTEGWEGGKRKVFFMALEVLQWVGNTCGPVVGGWISNEFGLVVPFYIQIGVNLLIGLLVVGALGETLLPQRRDVWSWARASPFGQIMALRLHPFLTTMALFWAVRGAAFSSAFARLNK